VLLINSKKLFGLHFHWIRPWIKYKNSKIFVCWWNSICITIQCLSKYIWVMHILFHQQTNIFEFLYLIQGLIQWKCNPNNFLLFINNTKKANLRFDYEQLYALGITFSQYTSLKNYPSCLSLWYYDIFRQHLYWFWKRCIVDQFLVLLVQLFLIKFAA
jgi:hypothetical protein